MAMRKGSISLVPGWISDLVMVVSFGGWTALSSV